MGLEAVVELSPVLGVQVYVLAPEAVRVVLNPLQMVTFEEIVTVGVALTVAATVVAVLTHPMAEVRVTE